MSEDQFLLQDDLNEISQNVSIYQQFNTKKINIQNAMWCEEIEKSVEYQQQLYNKYQDHIIKINEHKYNENTNIYTIESQKGVPLSQLYIDPNQIQNQSQCFEMIQKLFELDQFMKKEGIHHYNIKPNNIIQQDEKFKLTDFGYHNQFYVLRNFHQTNDQNFCQNNYPYLSNQVLQKIQQFSQSNVNQDFLNDVKQNLDQIYDDSDSQSIAFIMLEILMNQSIVRNSSIDWKQHDFKQFRQEKYEEVRPHYQHQFNQNFFQFLELYIMDRCFEFSKFEECNKLIDKFIKLNNFQQFEKKFMYLFNEKQLKTYDENCRSSKINTENTQFVQTLLDYQKDIKSKMKSNEDLRNELHNNQNKLKLEFGLNLLYQQIKCSNTQYDKNYYRLLATILEKGENIDFYLQKEMELFIGTFPVLVHHDDQSIELIDINFQIKCSKIDECRQYIEQEILNRNIRLNLQAQLYYLFSQKQLENYQIGLNDTIISNILEFAQSLQNSFQNEQEFKSLCSSFSKQFFAVNLLFEKIQNQNNSQNARFIQLAQYVMQQDHSFQLKFEERFLQLKSVIENHKQSSKSYSQQRPQQHAQQLPILRTPQLNYVINQQVTIAQLKDESVRKFLEWSVIVKQKKYQILQPNSQIRDSDCVHYEGLARTKIAIGKVTGFVLNGEAIESYAEEKVPEYKSCSNFCQNKQIQKKKEYAKYELISKTIKIIKHYENIRIDDINENAWKIQNNETGQITWYQLVQKEIKEKNQNQTKKIQSIKKIKFYQGGILDNLEDGKGKMKDYKKNLKYDGSWSQGKKSYGTLQILNLKDYLNGEFFMYEGQFYNDQFHGKGTVYLSSDKKIRQTGYFKNNNQKGIHQLYQNEKLVSRIIYCSICGCKVKINVPCLCLCLCLCCCA